jgi:Uma2 family endonuclease
MTAATLPARMSEDAYLAFEGSAPGRHECVNGEVQAMAGGTIAHAIAVASVGAALRAQLRAAGCVAATSELRVHVPTTGLYAYPDVVVFCGPPERHARDRETLTNPSLLVEVLSPTTAAYDRGPRFAHYRAIPSLRAYLLVDPETRTVELFERRPDGAWAIPAPVGPGGSLRLETFGIELSADALLEDLDRSSDAAGEAPGR